jgi:transcriptional regulator
MYIPKPFTIVDGALLDEFIRRNNFATLISTIDGAPFATHLPLLLDRLDGGRGVLLGHMARANPHWRAFDGRQQALAIFHGPHAYVSPSWYGTSPAVPTWNYTVVHVYGAPRLIDDDAQLSDLVDRLVAFHEAGMPQPWPGDLPPDFKRGLLKAIVGFVMPVERVEGKFKLSQNRPVEDQQGVVRGLEASPDPVARALGDLMRQRLG